VSPNQNRLAAAKWLHEIKHDGFRVMARVRLLTRKGMIGRLVTR
jgi:ATP-dependent DNA ligase